MANTTDTSPTVSSDYFTTDENFTATITSDLTSTETSTIIITTTTTTTTTTATTTDRCFDIKSNNITVQNRGSDMFTALISYDCPFTDLYSFTMLYDETSANCSILNNVSNITGDIAINVTCNNILNNAGRNWTFSINRTSSNSAVYFEDFTITLSPLNYTGFNYTTTYDNNQISITISKPDCSQIADLQYLVVRCNDSDKTNNTLSQNCTQVCWGLEHGSKYNVSLVRLPIPIADMNDTIPQYSQHIIIPTKLDSATNLSFINTSITNESVAINFTCPRGSYEKIVTNCSARDLNCPLRKNLTLDNSIVNCSNYTSITLPKVLQGVEYECKLITMKETFNNTVSDNVIFQIPLEPVLYNGSNSSNNSVIIFNVTLNSDFNTIASNCTVANNQSNPCENVTERYENCSTQLNLKGIPGCDYECSFITEKANYTSKNSQVYNFSIFPSKPNISDHKQGSRWISINWTISEVTYIQSFNIFSNTSMENFSDFPSDEKSFSYNFTTEIKPFRSYTLHVELVSNKNVSSETFSIETSEEAPPPPDSNDIEKKIIPQNDDELSTYEQYVIDIDPTLFSNEYGIVRTYLIYIRQDQTYNTSEVNTNGTYAEASRNISIDYLAVVIPIKSVQRNGNLVMNNITVILGNQTDCFNESIAYTPCNGPLKSSTTYRVILSACTIAGCENVLSKSFETKAPPPTPTKPSPSKGWVAIFPVLALVAVVVVLAGWKRKPLKRLVTGKIRKYRKSSKVPRSSGSISLTSVYTVPTKRPKPLYKYISMTNDDEKAIYNEYQDLEMTAPQYRQSDYEAEYATKNRYGNIPARGPWERTAVRLTADHRVDDYINANEIQGLHCAKQYIATQAPLPDTCQDFWEMILQYNVLKIVMVTRLKERNPHNPTLTVDKCHNYFPENKGDSLTFGPVVVQVIDIDRRPKDDLEIRLILIKDGNIEHRVYHYYFIGWPDFGVVTQPKLLDLIETINNHGQNLFKKEKERLTTPMVVHCSAGVGRTGTYIAVDIITKLIKQSENNLSTMQLDVMGVVYKLRQERVKMVQTKDQYMLVNRCVEEYLKRINRLNDIMRPPNIYENVSDRQSNTSTNIYMNNDISENNLNKKSSFKYNNTKGDNSSLVDNHSNSSGVVLRQSKYKPIHDQYDSKSKDDNTPSIPRRLPSIKRQQNDY
ncbi:unnamed protein product [Adineta steineri]|uniref:Protein-tyrosine-phosphatase n=1 Tax=Adineta steineri TaxID=433720 RepID=A0A814S0P4_9BILA|nr:unnamed protein product [Adineta steineri]CAF1491275.1 unnamed protein product [Adineta steineri]